MVFLLVNKYYWKEYCDGIGILLFISRDTGVQAFSSLIGNGLFDSAITAAEPEPVLSKLWKNLPSMIFCWSPKKETMFAESQEILGLYFN